MSAFKSVFNLGNIGIARSLERARLFGETGKVEEEQKEDEQKPRTARLLFTPEQNKRTSVLHLKFEESIPEQDAETFVDASLSHLFNNHFAIYDKESPGAVISFSGASTLLQFLRQQTNGNVENILSELQTVSFPAEPMSRSGVSHEDIITPRQPAEDTELLAVFLDKLFISFIVKKIEIKEITQRKGIDLIEKRVNKSVIISQEVKEITQSSRGDMNRFLQNVKRFIRLRGVKATPSVLYYTFANGRFVIGSRV